MEELDALLAKIDALPAVGRTVPLRQIVEQLCAVVEAVEEVTGATSEQVRAIVHEEVAGVETRILAALVAMQEPEGDEDEAAAPQLTVEDVRNAIDGSLSSFMGAFENLRLAVESLSSGVRALEAARVTQPMQQELKITPAQARKMVLAPVHLEIIPERRHDGRIERFIVNEQ